MNKQFLVDKPIVCVQGLGFVGSAMAIAVANAKDRDGNPIYNVVGIELNNKSGIEKVKALNNGRFPFQNNDPNIQKNLQNCLNQKNFYCTANSKWLEKAAIVISDVNLDVQFSNEGLPFLNLDNYKLAIETIGKYVKPETLVIIESTVPPGTCEKIVKPILETELVKRGLNCETVLLAHSYERVMPGSDYYDSIVNYWRVYSGINEESATRCEKFLRSVINYKKFPLTRLPTTTASEISKILENSYRATNIAFIDEWSRFAEAAGVDLFEVIDAIRVRPTHANIRQPGFGVGGYCLTKDPYFAIFGAKDILKLDNLKFPFSLTAISVNNKMPLAALKRIESMLDGVLKNKRILVCGVSYREDVGDTRFSPSEIFAREALKSGAVLEFHDPLVQYWEEMKIETLKELPSPDPYDAVVFAVKNKMYNEINMEKWLKNSKALVFDANNVLTAEQLKNLRTNNIKFASIGRGGR